MVYILIPNVLCTCGKGWCFKEILRWARFGWRSPFWSNSTRWGRWLIYWPCLGTDDALHSKLPQVKAPAGAVLKSCCTYLRWKLEHGGTHDEWSGVVLSCQCQSVSPTHSYQGAIGQDCLCTDDDLKRANQNWIACSTADWGRNTSWLRPWQMSWRRTVSVQPDSSWSYRQLNAWSVSSGTGSALRCSLLTRAWLQHREARTENFRRQMYVLLQGTPSRNWAVVPCCSTNLQVSFV